MERKARRPQRRDRDYLTNLAASASVYLGWPPSEFWRCRPAVFWAALTLKRKISEDVNRRDGTGHPHRLRR